MKKLFIYLVPLFGLFACQQQAGPDNNKAQVPTTTTAEDIQSVKNLIEGSFQEIWSNLDSTAIGKYHTDDFLLLENGIVWNNDSIKSYLNRERIEMEKEQYQRLNRFEYIKSVHRQNSVWIAYDNYGTWVKGSDTLGTAHWLESVIAIKKNDAWILEQLHSTRVRK